jgi:hypothetical protein
LKRCSRWAHRVVPAILAGRRRDEPTKIRDSELTKRAGSHGRRPEYRSWLHAIRLVSVCVDVLESAIEGVLSGAGISFRKTKRAERITGFDQTPDFIVPDEFNPQVVIEAKITEDDGTARDKVTRVQHSER